MVSVCVECMITQKVKEGSVKKNIATTLLAKNSTTVWDAAASAAKAGFGQQHGFFHVVLWEKVGFAQLPISYATAEPCIARTETCAATNKPTSTCYPFHIITIKSIVGFASGWHHDTSMGQETPGGNTSVVVSFFELHLATAEEKSTPQGYH
ncbi:hypothetical protein BC829DRAFT_214104 [Chytridium lagenaria]|nr:hypothetical protein BC829DRAFT_214104 [Chytridium lagenaria]